MKLLVDRSVHFDVPFKSKSLAVSGLLEVVIFQLGRFAVRNEGGVY